MNIGILWFSPRAPITSRAVEAEAKQVFDENAAFLLPPPVLDAVIIKATVSAGGENLHLTRTESYVFAKNSKGTWEYTEKYDAQFAQARL